LSISNDFNLEASALNAARCSVIFMLAPFTLHWVSRERERKMKTLPNNINTTMMTTIRTTHSTLSCAFFWLSLKAECWRAAIDAEMWCGCSSSTFPSNDLQESISRNIIWWILWNCKKVLDTPDCILHTWFARYRG
jgi:hypothetical protein